MIASHEDRVDPYVPGVHAAAAAAAAVGAWGSRRLEELNDAAAQYQVV